MSNIITIYYSLKGETIAPGMKIVNLEKGHTAVAAEFIQKAVDGDLFEIKTVKTYIEDHMKMIFEAKEELEKRHPAGTERLPESAWIRHGFSRLSELVEYAAHAGSRISRTL